MDIQPISANYSELLPGEIEQVAAECAEAWKCEAIPIRQYELAVKNELATFRAGGPVAPFDALLKCLKRLPVEFLGSSPSLLDAGASSGYYKEVINSLFSFGYTGCDFSDSFKQLAVSLYPDIAFDIEDARRLSYANECFDVVFCGAMLMHCREYSKALSELARVAESYVVLHRTPLLTMKPTTFFRKSAYDVPCLEIWFNESELFELFRENGLSVIWTENVFWDYEKSFGHRTFLLEKVA